MKDKITDITFSLWLNSSITITHTYLLSSSLSSLIWILPTNVLQALSEEIKARRGNIVYRTNKDCTG